MNFVEPVNKAKLLSWRTFKESQLQSNFILACEEKTVSRVSRPVTQKSVSVYSSVKIQWTPNLGPYKRYLRYQKDSETFLTLINIVSVFKIIIIFKLIIIDQKLLTKYRHTVK